MTAIVNGTHKPASPKLMALRISEGWRYRTYRGINLVLTFELIP